MYTTEEDVKIKFLIPYLNKRGFSSDQMDFEKAIEVQEGRRKKTIFADVVVYSSKRKTTPILLCETKGPREILDKQVKEQAISYARLLPRIAPIAIITNGSDTKIFQTVNKNRIPDLPSFRELESDIAGIVISKELQESLKKEAKHELFIIDDVAVFKNVLKQCHNEIRNNEGYDPTKAFDEMSKILFCKLYEEKHHKSINRFRVSIYDETIENLSVNVVKQIFDETKKYKTYADIFEKDSTIELSDRTIRKLVQLFEDYDLSLTAFDVKGEAFEYFLGDTFTGGLGEYFTPRNVVEFIIECLDPKIGEKIVDPFCGTGGFLIYTFDYINEKILSQDFSEAQKDSWRKMLSKQSLFGTDWKERTSQACKMNMMVHGDGNSGVFKHHGLVDVPKYIEEGQFDVCVTNPPFGSLENDPKILKKYDLGKSRNSQDRVILGLERLIRLAKPNARIGIIVIDGILNNRSMKYVRDYIKKNTYIRGIVSINKETFESYGARAKTSILFLEKKEKEDEGIQKSVMMAICNNTGYAPTGVKITGNQLPDIFQDYSAFLSGKISKISELSWIIDDLGDRLDAEYYRPTKNNNPIKDIRSASIGVANFIDEVRDRYVSFLECLEKARLVYEYNYKKVGEIIREVNNTVTIEKDNAYNLIGVRWWGGGVFVKETITGSLIKAKKLRIIKPNTLVYNRLFAFRGSFAIVNEDINVAYASNEFPCFELIDPSDGIEMLHYIAHSFNSPQYLELVDKFSTGSTKQSRNRFNEKIFLNMEIAIPKNKEDIILIVDAMKGVYDFWEKSKSIVKKSETLKETVGTIIPVGNKKDEAKVIEKKKRNQ
jgi:type I restriction enzyme M protein